MRRELRREVTDLREHRAALAARMHSILGDAEREHRDLTANEQHEYDSTEAQFDLLTRRIRTREEEIGVSPARGISLAQPARGAMDGPMDGQYSTRHDESPVLRRSQPLSDWARRAVPGFASQAQGLSFDRTIRGIVSGDWQGAEAEQRAISESPLTAGGHMVPTPLSLSVIDKARNVGRVFQAGATTVPMTAATLKLARLTAEGTPAWRTEGAAINDQALTFDSVTLTAQTMAILVKCSLELFEDAPESDDVIANSFAEQIALELDRVALRGSGTSPEPRGIRNQTGVTITTHGANGDTIANLKYNFLIDALASARAANFEPNAIIDAPRTEQGLSKLVDTTGQYIVPPAALADVPRLPTNQVPINLTVGSSTDTSEVYTGQWDHLLIGLRTNFTIRFLSERFIDNGQYAFMCYLRGDVQLSQPAAFVVDTGVRG